MNAIVPRRSFLRGLVTLPLVGGSVSLLGQPSAVAEPVTQQILEAYKTWLHYEHRHLAWEMSELPGVVAHYGGNRDHRFEMMDRMVMHLGAGEASRFHFRRAESSAPASSRAALVLSTVGCDWQDKEAPSDWLLPLGRA